MYTDRLLLSENEVNFFKENYFKLHEINERVFFYVWCMAVWHSAFMLVDLKHYGHGGGKARWEKMKGGERK